jgi:hypothetical protein
MDAVKHSHRIRILAARGIATGLIALLCGCNYFRPSQPELPTSTGVDADYSSAEATILTIQQAIRDKSSTNGQSAYIGAFSDLGSDGVAYVAEFDPITVARFPGQPIDWDRGREEIFYANLARLLPSSTFDFVWGTFTGAPDDDRQTDSAILYRSYLITATPDDGLTSVPVARGNAQLHFVKIRDNWKLVRWIDSEDPLADFLSGELSFGQLRLAGP